MQIGVDTAVFCDGKLCGVSHNLIVYPHPLRLTHLIISVNNRERITPVAMIIESSDSGIYLKPPLAELSTLDSFTQMHFAEITVPDYDFAEFNYTYPMSGEQSRISIPVVSYNTPPGGFVISRQTQIEAKNGHIGQFKKLIIDPATYQITHLIFQRGHLWERKYVTIPAFSVERMEGDTIYLNINKADV